MRTNFSNKNLVQENVTLASYGFGILSKGQRLTNAIGYLYNDVAMLTDSRITDLFMQLQAGFSLGSAQKADDLTSTCSSSFFTFGNISHTAKGYINTFTEHPISKFARSFFFYKQTLDFGIASCQWVTGNRSSKSLLHQGVNTALAYIPIIAATSALGEGLPTQLAINALTFGCLAYSIRQDVIHSTSPTSRESSPSISLIRNQIVPKVQGFIRSFWG